jgi:hypothetical protein
LGYAIVTIIMLRSVLWHLASRVPHDPGDPLLSATILWWNAHVMPLTDRWWNGFGFWPAPGMLAFSDHRLGESLIATPLQWAGAGTVSAYNITLLAMFPLSAIAAHWFAFALTRRHDASLLAGLAYGFNPYRLAHIEHLELLGAFGMPAALAALHLYLEHRRLRWLVVFGIAVLLQALLSTYYFLFFGVMLGLWAAWFVRGQDRGVLIALAWSIALVLAALSPLLWSYRAIHQHYGFARRYQDIITLSADVTSFVTASPLLALWGWTAPLNGPERQLFPGATILVVIAAGVGAALRSACVTLAANRLTLALVGVATLCAAVAGSALVIGPWRIDAGLVLSVRTAFKPFSLALAALAAAMLVSSPGRSAYRRRSAFAFYLLCAAFLLLCTLGPKPRFRGSQFLYEPPYAWLMRIRLFGEGVRVPARFAMPAILALSAAAALAFARLTNTRGSRWVLAGALGAAIVADAWIVRLPTVEPPAPPAQVSTAGAVAFVELPLGDPSDDTLAMYRAILMHLPTVNGYSGNEPSYYDAVRIALEERDDSVLDALASQGPIVVVVRRQADSAPARLEWLHNNPRAVPLAQDATSSWFLVHAPPTSRTRCSGPVLPIVAASDREGRIDLRMLTDGDDNTFWISGTGQQVGDTVDFDLGGVVQPCSVQLSLGSHIALFPRRLNVATSVDGESWSSRFDGAMGGPAVLAAIERPRDARLEIPLQGERLRFVRFRLTASQANIPWIVTEAAVIASPSDERSANGDGNHELLRRVGW